MTSPGGAAELPILYLVHHGAAACSLAGQHTGTTDLALPAHILGSAKGYPPGIRENGGQYTLDTTWVALAFAVQSDGDRSPASSFGMSGQRGSAFASAIEVLAANGVTTMIDNAGGDNTDARQFPRTP